MKGLSWKPKEPHPLDGFSGPDLELTEEEYEELCEEEAGCCMECGDIMPDQGSGTEKGHCRYCKENAVFGIKRLKELDAVIFTEGGLREM